MTTQLARVPQWQSVDEHCWRTEILPAYRPAVLKGFVRHWPAVAQAQRSPQDIAGYLVGMDNGHAVDALMTPPQEGGRLFYQADMNGFNYLRNKLPISRVVEQLARYSQFATAPAVAVQSALTAECLPGFAEANAVPFLDAAIAPRIWIGNRVTTPAHFDESNNLACVVSGHRRFTLFPPEQVANLYIGPLDYAPTATPISLVDFRAPDLARFPRFAQALAAAQVAELEPGDALYIPTLWWHHVESLDVFNVLVNYWWRDADPAEPPASPFDSLVHCLRHLRHLPPEHRAAWKAIFDHYVFDGALDPGAHIPAHRRGVLADVRPPLEKS